MAETRIRLQKAIDDLATIRAGASAGASAYQKPGTGVPATDLAAAVQTTLDKADKQHYLLKIDPETGAIYYTTPDDDNNNNNNGD